MADESLGTDAQPTKSQAAEEHRESPEEAAATLAAQMHVPPPRVRLSDRQAVTILGAYFGVRFVTVRLGLAFFPTLLVTAPWALPLLRNTAGTLLAVAAAEHDNFVVIGAALAGSLFISMAAGLMIYWAGYRFGPWLAERGAQEGAFWASVWNPKQVARAHRWLERRGVVAVAASRAVGFLNLPVSLVAGSSRMPFGQFALAQFLGSVTWAVVCLWLGIQAGTRWPGITDFIKSLSGFSTRFGLVAFVVLIGAAALASRASRNAPRKPQG